MMLKAVPPLILPMVTTALSRGLIFRLFGEDSSGFAVRCVLRF
jgi:hypothetical protein